MDTLVIPLAVVVGHEFRERPSQMVVSEEYQAVQALF
jgi:hypothetical protein